MPCRKAETEADSIGMRLAAKACYDPSAAGETLLCAMNALTWPDSAAWQCIFCPHHTSTHT